MATATPSDEFLKAILCCSFQIGSSLVSFGITGNRDKDNIELSSELESINDWITKSKFNETHTFVTVALPLLITNRRISKAVQKQYAKLHPCEWVKLFKKYEEYFSVSTGINIKVLLDVCGIIRDSGGLSPGNATLINHLKITFSLKTRSVDRKAHLVGAMNAGQPFIMPMFKSNHAVYIAVEPLINEPCRVGDTFRFAICNGGIGIKAFHGANALDQEVDVNGDVSHYYAHCICTTSDEGLLKLIDTVELQQYTDNIIPEVRYLMEDKVLYNRLDPIQLFQGRGGGVFAGKEVRIKKQQVGNCSMHNLIQALRYADKSYVAPITMTNNKLVRNMVDLERAGAVTRHLYSLLLYHKNILSSKYGDFCVQEALRQTKDYYVKTVRELAKLN